MGVVPRHDLQVQVRTGARAGVSDEANELPDGDVSPGRSGEEPKIICAYKVDTSRPSI